MRQPYGTYESFHWGFCEASLAYVRLVRLGDEQVAAFKADQARQDRRVLGYDDDNFSRYWMWGGESAEKILRIFEPFRYADVDFVSLCLGVPGMMRVPSPYNELYVNRGRRLGDKRMRNMYADLVAQDIDLLKLATERAHKYGIKFLPGWRMSSGSPAKFNKELAKCRLKTCSRLDFAYPQVREYFVKSVRHILETYDVDGFILNFSRHCIHFNPDEPDKYGHMNRLSADMRAMVDEVSRKKDKKLLLAATFSENDYVSGFMKHYLKVDVAPKDRLKYQGIDVEAWIKNRYYDIIMPEGRNVDKYIAMTRGTTTKCYPRWEYHCNAPWPTRGRERSRPDASRGQERPAGQSAQRSPRLRGRLARPSGEGRRRAVRFQQPLERALATDRASRGTGRSRRKRRGPRDDRRTDDRVRRTEVAQLSEVGEKNSLSLWARVRADGRIGVLRRITR